MQKASKIILGIDPGTLVMGHGLIEVKGHDIKLIDLGVLKINSKVDTYERLHKIHEQIHELIKTYKPNSFAIEAPFFGKNVQSMLKLGRAQGVAIAAAIQANLDITEYSPKKIKQSITGNGNAGKEQVMRMLQQILNFKEDPNYLDATDALAVAVCHHFQQSKPGTETNSKSKSKSKSKSGGWADFLKDNPGRIKK